MIDDQTHLYAATGTPFSDPLRRSNLRHASVLLKWRCPRIGEARGMIPWRCFRSLHSTSFFIVVDQHLFQCSLLMPNQVTYALRPPPKSRHSNAFQKPRPSQHAMVYIYPHDHGWRSMLHCPPHDGPPATLSPATSVEINRNYLCWMVQTLDPYHSNHDSPEVVA